MPRSADCLSKTGYEPLRCSNCGKNLGYIRLDVKMYPPKRIIRITTGGPTIKVKKEVFCEECFSKLKKPKLSKTKKAHAHHRHPSTSKLGIDG